MEPRFEQRDGFRVVGMCGWFDNETRPKIGALWGEFHPHMNEPRRTEANRSYGVCFHTKTGEDPRFFYMAAVAVEDFAEIPTTMVAKSIPANRYAVFTHKGPISAYPETLSRIWGEWMPRSEYRPAPGPDFELYDERFGDGGPASEFDVWVPIRPKG